MRKHLKTMENFLYHKCQCCKTIYFYFQNSNPAFLVCRNCGDKNEVSIYEIAFLSSGIPDFYKKDFLRFEETTWQACFYGMI